MKHSTNHLCPHTLALQLANKLTPYQAWLLGRVNEQLQCSVVSESEALDQAACILLDRIEPRTDAENIDQAELMDPLLEPTVCANRRESLPQLTRTALSGIGHALKSRQNGALARLAGVLSLANIIWVLGTAGVAIAFFPAAYPLMSWLGTLLGPAFIAIHTVLLPYYSLLCYALCLYLVACATR